jgi:hypothetical protein
LKKNQKKVVFIMGAGHCGSTLLDLVLGSHSIGFSLCELNAIHKSVDHDKGEYFKICSVCKNKCPIWNDRASERILSLYFSRKNRFRSAVGKLTRYFFNPYNIICDWTGKSMLIDSSKHPIWFKRQLVHARIGAPIEPYLIYLTRDGRAVVNSYLRKYPERGINQIAETWKFQIGRMNSFYKHFPRNRRLQVRYEDLATKSEIVVKSICDFLRINYEREMLLYWQHDHHPVHGNLGTHSLLFNYRNLFQNGASKYCDDLNRGNKYYDKEYYRRIGLAIKLDLRWQKEMSPDALKIFDKIVGDMNLPFRFDECD